MNIIDNNIANIIVDNITKNIINVNINDYANNNYVI
jgi:hypothetical protein